MVCVWLILCIRIGELSEEVGEIGGQGRVVKSLANEQSSQQ